ncbi:hypothetical protein ACJJIQ_09250 [Microbulbifer sp. ANSA003]|uniref:hypothetical protein n=1 Tax=Microbulbifer sp. ANSA003 TaxID=3243360 RepID=UPI004041A15D
MESEVKAPAVNRFAIFAGRVHLMNGGARNFRNSASTEQAAMELAVKIAKKSQESQFFSWLQIVDRATEKYTEYSILRGGELEEREKQECPE